MFYERLLRPILFRADAEDAHVRVLHQLHRWRQGGRLAEALCTVTDPRLHTRVLGLDLRNPVGLAAGLDKHAEAVHAWRWLGLGHAEIGTVTPLPQPGNPRPRLFRLIEDEAIINRMGFNSLGAAAVRANLEAAGEAGIPIGVNVGKNKDTDLAAAVDDYVAAISELRGRAAYFVVNLSSPNTPDLRRLQAPEAIRGLVESAVGAAGGTPVLVKLAPDFAPGTLAASVDAALAGGAAGFLATNTTVTRPDALRSPWRAEVGGLSGKPLRDLATATIRQVFAQTAGRVPIIGIGGIASAQDAYDKVLAGADLVQVYTGLIYHGPLLVRQICSGLADLLERDGCRSVADAVGQGA